MKALRIAALGIALVVGTAVSAHAQGGGGMGGGRGGRGNMLMVGIDSTLSPDQKAKVAEVMAKANWHTYQVLTKRSERMANLLAGRLAKVAALPHIWW